MNLNTFKVSNYVKYYGVIKDLHSRIGIISQRPWL